MFKMRREHPIAMVTERAVEYIWKPSTSTSGPKEKRKREKVGLEIGESSR